MKTNGHNDRQPPYSEAAEQGVRRTCQRDPICPMRSEPKFRCARLLLAHLRCSIYLLAIGMWRGERELCLFVNGNTVLVAAVKGGFTTREFWNELERVEWE